MTNSIVVINNFNNPDKRLFQMQLSDNNAQWQLDSEDYGVVRDKLPRYVFGNPYLGEAGTLNGRSVLEIIERTKDTLTCKAYNRTLTFRKVVEPSACKQVTNLFLSCLSRLFSHSKQS